MKYIKWYTLLLAIIVLVSCSSSKVTTYWKKPGLEPQSFKKIMVIGVIKETDRSFRERMENHLVDDLKALGYNAYSSLNEYGPVGLANMTEEQVHDKLVKEGVDAVLTIVLLDKAKEKYYVPGRAIYTPYGGYYNRFWRYYTVMYDRIEQPGYYEESTHYFWESNLYDLKKKELIYSVQTQSFDPGSAETLGHEYGKLIVQDMVKHQLLSSQNKPAAKAM